MTANFVMQFFRNLPETGTDSKEHPGNCRDLLFPDISSTTLLK